MVIKSASLLFLHYILPCSYMVVTSSHSMKDHIVNLIIILTRQFVIQAIQKIQGLLGRVYVGRQRKRGPFQSSNCSAAAQISAFTELHSQWSISSTSSIIGGEPLTSLAAPFQWTNLGFIKTPSASKHYNHFLTLKGQNLIVSCNLNKSTESTVEWQSNIYGNPTRDGVSSCCLSQPT